ncbi:MAG: carboxypeptidase regulatory-like domain-containing protein, partial [Gemmatimonadales bacterium]
MKKLAWSLLLILLPLALHAQSSLHGTVVDQLSGAPVTGATVTVTGTDHVAKTNGSGQFTLTSSDPITSITARAVGYGEQVLSISDMKAAIRIELVRSATTLPGIEVVARRQEASTGVITRDDLNRTSGLSLSDALNTLPGVLIKSMTPFW